MTTRRRALRALAVGLISAALLPIAPWPSQAAADAGTAVDTVKALCDVLLAVMKDGPALGFGGRRDKLTPALRRAFDLPLMARLTVGPQWPELTPAQQRQFVDAFSAFSVATYASRFDDYAGQRFDVDTTPATVAGGDQIVHTKLVKRDGQAIQLDYLLRNSSGRWQIIDVYLSGTISELATRRSEFSSVLRQKGADALVDLLQQRTAKLSS
jgi:phospholipid transport system substrate-binding protein